VAATVTRPDREVIAAAVFDEHGHIRPEIKTKCDQLRCDRRKHTVVVARRTTYGWWVAWREPYGASGSGWNHDWLDEMAGPIEAECNCRRRRRVDPLFALL
jgi:hypothetical protein